jgi:hypothetical protein
MKHNLLLLIIFFVNIPAFAMQKRPSLKKESALLCIGWILNKKKEDVQALANEHSIRINLHEGIKNPKLTQVFTNQPETLKKLLIEASIRLHANCSE